MRQRKKSGEISKYYSDESGQLTVMVKKKEENGVKQRVTYHSRGKNIPPTTLTEEELVEMVRKGRSWAEAVDSQ